jgi:uncharacterized protein (TIGR03437 family)
VSQFLTPKRSLAVVNAANNLPAAGTPGKIIALYGSNLGPNSVAAAAPA